MVFEKIWYYQKHMDFVMAIIALLYGHIINITLFSYFLKKLISLLIYTNYNMLCKLGQ